MGPRASVDEYIYIFINYKHKTDNTISNTTYTNYNAHLNYSSYSDLLLHYLQYPALLTTQSTDYTITYKKYYYLSLCNGLPFFSLKKGETKNYITNFHLI